MDGVASHWPHAAAIARKMVPQNQGEGREGTRQERSQVGTGAAERKANPIQTHHPILLQHSLFEGAGRAGSTPDPTFCGTKDRSTSFSPRYRHTWSHISSSKWKTDHKITPNLLVSQLRSPPPSHPQTPEHSQRAKSVETFIKHKAQRNTSLLNGSKSESAPPARPRGTPGLPSPPPPAPVAWDGEPEPKG